MASELFERVNNLRLTYHYARLIKNELDCWKECLKDIECFSITTWAKNCFLYKRHNYGMLNYNEWVSYFKAEKKLKMKLSNAYRRIDSTGIIKITEQECWNACMNESLCSAISLNYFQCLLFKNDFIASDVDADDWISYFKVTKFTEAPNKSIVEVRNDTRLTEHYKHFPDIISNNYRCWSTCQIE